VYFGSILGFQLDGRSGLPRERPQQHAYRDAHVAKGTVSINVTVGDAVLRNVNVDKYERKGVDHLVLVQSHGVEVVHQALE
jgi:hypothetical protein